MTDYKSLLLYYYKGNTNTQIATICGCSRTTVIKTIKRAKELNLKLPLPATLRDSDLYLMLYPKRGKRKGYYIPDIHSIEKDRKKRRFSKFRAWQKYCRVAKREGYNAKFARMPFVFTMYRMGVKKHMAKNFPPEGWKTEWVRCDGKEIHFNLRSCLYHDICVEKGCPELCRVYCENDNIAFSGLMPKIRFERVGTIGEGAECCDFHFINAKK